MLEFLSANQAYYKLSKMVQYIEIGPVVPEIFDFLFKSVAVSRTLPRGPRIDGRFAARNTVKRYLENSSSKNFNFCNFHLVLA